ncbi:hypothetical protein BFJ71_g15218 [Fusarium oxysporum]|nr:hypothetical protein BFJ71_g15218 [Fusarium oxysporum]
MSKRFLPSRLFEKGSRRTPSTAKSTQIQNIEASNIDPDKLAQHLSSEFKHNNFQVDLVQNTYIIRAPRILLDVSAQSPGSQSY